MNEAELVAEARSWIEDCVWVESDTEDEGWVSRLSDGQVRRGVETHFCGGWAEFVRVMA